MSVPPIPAAKNRVDEKPPEETNANRRKKT